MSADGDRGEHGDASVTEEPGRTSEDVDGPRVTVVAQSPYSLRFADSVLEQAYLDLECRRSLRWVPKSLLFGGLLTLAFLPVDGILVPEDAVTITRFIRAFLIAPIPLLGIVGYRLIQTTQGRARLLEGGVIMVGLLWTGMILYGGAATVPYHTFALVQTQLCAFVLFGLPYQRALRSAGLFSAAFLLGVAVLDTPVRFSLLAYGGVPAFLLIAAVGLYRYEFAARQRFLAERQLVEEFNRRVDSERERRQWLETFAGFLRHELRNSLTGVGTSLELSRRVMQDDRGQEYLSRAQRSLQYMRQMLRQVADATSIEAALKTQRQEVVDLSALVADRIADLHSGVWERVDLVAGTPGLRVRCDPDSVVQMLDKLLNNALEHADDGSKVTLALRRDGQYAQLEIVDRGDALPENSEAIFQPFVSSKSGSGDGNLGLGLYVARVIVDHLGGEIRAERLSDPTGARFVVRLPLVSPSTGDV